MLVLEQLRDNDIELVPHIRPNLVQPEVGGTKWPWEQLGNRCLNDFGQIGIAGKYFDITAGHLRCFKDNLAAPSAWGHHLARIPWSGEFVTDNGNRRNPR